MPVASRSAAIDGACDMAAMSQTVINSSSLQFHNLCVEPSLEISHNVNMTEDDKNGGPNFLKVWREFRRMTQAELAEKVGTNANMIGYLETGERGLSLKWLRRLAPALDTNVGMLAQFDPNDLDNDLIEIWATASNRDKRKIVEVSKLVISSDGQKDGTRG